MLAKFDNYLIKQEEKLRVKKQTFADRFVRSKYGLLLSFLLAMKQTIEHAIEKWEHHQYIVFSFFVLIIVAMVFLNIRHHFYHKKIDNFEAKLKFAEGCLMIYLSVLRVIEMIHLHKTNFHLFIYIICGSISIFFLYFYIARRHHLIYKGVIIPHNFKH